MEMKGKLVDASRNMFSQKWRLTFEVENLPKVDTISGKDLRVTVIQWREKRSLNANAYFHVLVNQIASKMNIGDDECKRELVLEYGTVDRDENGKVIGAKLPAYANVTKYWPYAKHYETQYEGGREYHCYLFYKPTHELDSAEMARLIDGTVREAEQLGIETLTPAKLRIIKESWRPKDAG